jgi:hypothetical protein
MITAEPATSALGMRRTFKGARQVNSEEDNLIVNFSQVHRLLI